MAGRQTAALVGAATGAVQCHCSGRWLLRHRAGDNSGRADGRPRPPATSQRRCAQPHGVNQYPLCQYELPACLLFVLVHEKQEEAGACVSAHQVSANSVVDSRKHACAFLIWRANLGEAVCGWLQEEIYWKAARWVRGKQPGAHCRIRELTSSPMPLSLAWRPVSSRPLLLRRPHQIPAGVWCTLSSRANSPRQVPMPSGNSAVIRLSLGRFAGLNTYQLLMPCCSSWTLLLRYSAGE